MNVTQEPLVLRVILIENDRMISGRQCLGHFANLEVSGAKTVPGCSVERIHLNGVFEERYGFVG